MQQIDLRPNRIRHKNQRSIRLGHFLLTAMFVLFGAYGASAQTEFEGDRIDSIRLVVDGVASDAVGSEVLGRAIRESLGQTYSAVRVRDAIERLHAMNDILAVDVAANR